MTETLQFVTRHGYAVLLAWVFAEQVGLPLPSVPILLAAGALAGTGRMHYSLTVLLAVGAALVSDLLWYQIGRRRGIKVLKLLCRISLEPDSCVRSTEDIFARHGARSLLLAKFIPGLNTASPPLAGVFKMPLARFLLFDILGAVLWAGSVVGAGYVFSDKLELVAAEGARLGAGLVLILVGGLAAFILWKYVRRQRFLRELRLARITPEELYDRMNSGEDLVILDLRHSLSFEAEPELIPGAQRLDPDDIERAQELIPRDRDIVLYCT